MQGIADLRAAAGRSENPGVGGSTPSPPTNFSDSSAALNVRRRRNALSAVITRAPTPWAAVRGQNRSVNPAEPPQSADPFDSPLVTAPVNFSALVSLYSAPTRSSRGSVWPGEMAVEPSRNANTDSGPIEYAGPTLQLKALRKSVPGGSPTNVYDRV